MCCVNGCSVWGMMGLRVVLWGLMAWCQTCTIKPGGWNRAKSWHHLLIHIARGRTLWSDKSSPGTGPRTGMQENTPLSHLHSRNHSCCSQMSRLPPSMQDPFLNASGMYNSPQQAAWLELWSYVHSPNGEVLYFVQILHSKIKMLWKFTHP